jgi:hypothetical protein
VVVVSGEKLDTIAEIGCTDQKKSCCRDKSERGDGEVNK